MQRKSYFMFLPFMVILFSFKLTFGQGIIVNEASQGQGGTREFMELLVIGSAGSPTANVDLTGWIFDDNNGDFEASGSGVGIAGGYVVITGACLNSVPPGSLIVIYNDAEPNTNLPADDVTDANNDGVYVIPISDACFSRCTTNPSTSAGTSYIACTGGLNTPATWSTMSFRNGGDVAQTRRPDGTFFHGFAYGDVNANIVRPNFPSGTASFNIGAMGGGHFGAMGCGNGAWESSGNYTTGAATSDTPGAANNAANTILINEIKSGSFDYGNFDNPDNCDGIILPVELISFEGNRKYTDVILAWATTSETDNDHFDIEKSRDGHNFEKIGSVQGKGTTLSIQKYQFNYPSESYKTEYYRLKQVDFDATSTYSPVIAISPMQNEGLSLETHPQPFQNTLKLNFNSSKEEHMTISIYNTLGEVVHHQKEFYQKGKNDLTLSTQTWSLGTYFVQIKSQTEVLTKRVLKIHY